MILPTQEVETHTERLARLRSQLSADDGQDRSNGAAAAHAAADEEADDAGASDSEAEPEQAAAQDTANGRSAQHLQVADERPRKGRKKGKRKRELERKRPGKRQRAELRQQQSAAGLPQRVGKRAAGHDSAKKRFRKKVKPTEGPANGKQALPVVPAAKPKQKSK